MSHGPRPQPPQLARTHARCGGAFIGCTLLLASVVGCKFKPTHDMDEQPSVHPPYKESKVFPNGSAARPLPAGVIARPAAHSPGNSLTDLPSSTRTTATDEWFPIPITAEFLERGQQRFEVFCAPCHGRVGDGRGMIVQRGFTPPPSFHIDRLRAATDDHFYDVITHGYGAMYSYNDRLNPEDRWAVVQYVRALQLSTTSANPSSTLTDQDRVSLKGVRP